MKIIDDIETQINNNSNNITNKGRKEKGDRSYGERVRAKWFCCAFKLGFLQLIICKASSIFKSNLELALSIILKQRELYDSKYNAVESRCLTIWNLLPFLICSSILVITKPDKGNGVVILDRKLYNNAIEEIISDTSKFEKLSEDPTLKCKAFYLIKKIFN